MIYNAHFSLHQVYVTLLSIHSIFGEATIVSFNLESVIRMDNTCVSSTTVTFWEIRHSRIFVFGNNGVSESLQYISQLHLLQLLEMEWLACYCSIETISSSSTCTTTAIKC